MVGINRAFPFLEDSQSLQGQIGTLFKLVHEGSFSTSTQALVLISRIALDSLEGKKKKSGASSISKDLINRFYRALYVQLMSDQLLTKSKNTLFLNLLYRSMKHDPCDRRCAAFLKRLMICATQCPPHIAAGLIFIVSEVLKIKASLISLVTKVEADTLPEDFEDDGNSVHDDDNRSMVGSIAGSIYDNGTTVFGCYDPNKREPLFAMTGNSNMWELAMFRHHFHPSLQSFSRSLFDEPHEIKYQGDPTVDFNLSSFLERFSYKNPKAKKSNTRQMRHLSEAPINSADFIAIAPEKVAPDKVFFYKFFGAREKLVSEGKTRNRAKNKKRYREEDEDEDEEGDFDEEAGLSDDADEFGSDLDEREIDKFADKLAMDLMRSGGKVDEDDDDVDIDDDGSADDDNDEDYVFNNDESEYLDSGADDSQDEDIFENDDFSDNDYETPYHEESDILDLEDFVKSKKGAKSSVVTNSSDERPKKQKKSKHDPMSDFAPAEDYEHDMEEIVSKIHRNQNMSIMADSGSSEDDGMMKRVKVKTNKKKSSKK